VKKYASISISTRDETWSANITYDRNPLYIMFKLLITFCSSSGELVQLI